MSAYATPQLQQQAQLHCIKHVCVGASTPTGDRRNGQQPADDIAAFGVGGAEIIDQLLDRLVERLAVAVAERLAPEPRIEADEWLDSRAAAQYLGIHRDTLRRLAAARQIPAEQDGRGCKLFFRRAELAKWRRTGGQIRHLAPVADVA